MHRLHEFGRMVAAFRISKGLSQAALAKHFDVTRSPIALLEQGFKLPEAVLLERICRHLGIPEEYWRVYLDTRIAMLNEFEYTLGELVGTQVALHPVDPAAAEALQSLAFSIFETPRSREQATATRSRPPTCRASCCSG